MTGHLLKLGACLGFMILARQQAAAEEFIASGENCTFRAAPDEFLSRESRGRDDLAERAKAVGRLIAASGGRQTVDANQIPRKNMIDTAIFDQLVRDKVPSAKLTTDAEFARRLYLDLTGRIPSPFELSSFLNSPHEDRRERLIDQLINSVEFVDKWATWLGDLLANNSVQSNINRQVFGRNAFHEWIKDALYNQRSWRTMAAELVTAEGNNFDGPAGATNFLLGGRAVMGPNQDIYDLMAYQTSERLLGLGHYDCLMCHDGRRHLDELSLWGKSVTRLEAQSMAAYFSRVTVTGYNNRDANANPYYTNSFILGDRTTGNYALNTNFGNRPNRVRVGTLTAVDAEWRDGVKPKTAYWRAEFAARMVDDPLFAVNMVNRVWKAMFNQALAEPVNGLDPARLDPGNPPPAPWTPQASHPRLLRQLATHFIESNYNIRETLRLIAESSAYQLSTRYDAPWNASMVPLFARHYPRRLEGEEVHDAIVKATGIMTNYNVQGWAQPTPWAMQLPEPREPLSNGTSLTFMNTFLRGNRDTQQRSQSGSILQQLYLMNDSFVSTRLKVAASPNLRAIAANPDNRAVARDLFHLFLARDAEEKEIAEAAAHLASSPNAASRNTYIEDLAWVLVNKAEFVFSY